MAWANTAYATAAQYRERNGRNSSADDTWLNATLVSVSRVVDRRLGVAPAFFAPQTAVTFIVPAMGGTLLRLRDASGYQFFLRTVTADKIEFDSELDGTFDGYVLDLADAWVHGYPRNAALYGEPFTALELAPGVTSASPIIWTVGGDVRITGDGGWTAVPGGITDRVIGITRALVDAHSAGSMMTLQDMDTAIQMTPGAISLMLMLEREYNYSVLSLA